MYWNFGSAITAIAKCDLK